MLTVWTDKKNHRETGFIAFTFVVTFSVEATRADKLIVVKQITAFLLILHWIALRQNARNKDKGKNKT